MNIVILSNCAPEDLYLIQALKQARHNVTTIQLVPSSPTSTRPNWTSRTLQWMKKPLSQAYWTASHIYYRHLDAKMRKDASNYLKNTGLSDPPKADFQIPDRSVNGSESQSLIKKLDPDYLLVSGAPIIKENIFSSAKQGCINIHQGIVPQYRGGHTNWWPFFYGDYDNVGVSIHFINEGLDTGKLIAYGFVSLDEGDNEGTIAAKCGVSAANLMIDYLVSQQQFFRGVPQTGNARVFRYADRKLETDISYLLKRPFRKRPHRPERHVKFF